MTEPELRIEVKKRMGRQYFVIDGKTYIHDTKIEKGGLAVVKFKEINLDDYDKIIGLLAAKIAVKTNTQNMKA